MKVNFSCKTFGPSSFTQASFFLIFALRQSPLLKWNTFYLVYVNAEFIRKFLKKKKKDLCWVIIEVLLELFRDFRDLFAPYRFFFFWSRHFVRIYFTNSVTLRKFCRRNLKIAKIKFTKTFENNPFPCSRDMS